MSILIPGVIALIFIAILHSFFGMKIIQRGIIFTDLAIAQGAAFGLSLSLILEYDNFSYVFSLGFAFLVSMLIGTFYKQQHIEAFVASMYAFFSGLIVLSLSSNPHGSEIFARLVSSDVLFISFEDVYEVAFLYGLTLLFLSTLYKKIESQKLQNIIFFLLFALTLTSSVKLVGVIMVFTLLISGPLVATLLKKGFLFASSLSCFMVILTLAISYYFDSPSSATIVTICALLSIIVYIYCFLPKVMKK